MAAEANGTSHGARSAESSAATAGPSTALEALQAFKEAQERRVAHWQEYDEAMRHYDDSTPRLQQASSNDAGEIRTGPTPSSEAASTSGQGQGRGRGCGHGSSSHYDEGPLPISDELMAKILSLVTSGLLDCSHTVRTVETELRTALSRSDLADLVGKVQALENTVLRSIVERDQNKRRARLEARDLDADIQASEATVRQTRQEIAEVMTEINAEMAEL